MREEPRLFPDLRSNRLLLRRLEPSDRTRLCEYRSLPDVARFQSWERFGIEDADRLLASQTGLEFGKPGTWFQLAILHTQPSRLIGDCGLHFLSEDPRQVEIGITLDPSQQRLGFATEALRCVLSYLFDVANAHRAFAVTDADNHPAARLFRRLGFRQEGHFIEHVRFKGAYGSEYQFALLAREWHEAHERVPSADCQEQRW